MVDPHLFNCYKRVDPFLNLTNELTYIRQTPILDGFLPEEFRKNMFTGEIAIQIMFFDLGHHHNPSSSFSKSNKVGTKTTVIRNGPMSLHLAVKSSQ